MKNIPIYTEAVKLIKEAILQSQYRATSYTNNEQLSLYYGIGRYVSENSRKGFWGSGAIESISLLLQKELPGLRGFSAANIKFMRQFYETWCVDLKSLTAVSEINSDKSLAIVSEINTQLLTNNSFNKENTVAASSALFSQPFLEKEKNNTGSNECFLSTLSNINLFTK